MRIALIVAQKFSSIRAAMVDEYSSTLLVGRGQNILVLIHRMSLYARHPLLDIRLFSRIAKGNEFQIYDLHDIKKDEAKFFLRIQKFKQPKNSETFLEKDHYAQSWC